jgi:nitroimidazol reductase NimA-like FMN-containing flavoprotein (pyridoxamine 5'-phosphate oxidase superfamily)
LSEHSPSALEDIGREECVRLLATVPVGRLAIGVPGAPPFVVPVNYVLDGESIVFRSDPGEKIVQLRGNPVSFQVDQIDFVAHTGWSVLIQGVAHQATVAEIEQLQLEPWAPGEKAHWVRIVPWAITGRRITVVDVRRRGGDGYL